MTPVRLLFHLKSLSEEATLEIEGKQTLKLSTILFMLETRRKRDQLSLLKHKEFIFLHAHQSVTANKKELVPMHPTLSQSCTTMLEKKFGS